MAAKSYSLNAEASRSLSTDRRVPQRIGGCAAAHRLHAGRVRELVLCHFGLGDAGDDKKAKTDQRRYS